MLGNTIVGLLILGAIVGAYSGGWHRGKNGLKLWPFTAGKDGIHRQPLVVFAVCAALSLTACISHDAPADAPGAPAVSDSARHDGDHDRDHDKGKGRDKHKHHEDAAKP